MHAVSADSDLRIVDFAHPPVTEVALAIQFDAPSIELLDVAAIANFVRSELPGISEQPARPPMGESFGRPTDASQLGVQLLEPGFPLRYWMLSEDESRLLQVQHDFVALNWRRQESTPSSYPRYTTLRSSFARYLDEIERVVVGEGKSKLQPNWCEVTYVNHVEAASGSEPLMLSEVTNVAWLPPEDAFLPRPEDAQFGMRFLIEDGGSPIGRLTIGANPVIRRADGMALWSITLTARVRSAEGSLAGAFRALDVGHEWVVRGFRDVTTPSMHRLWGLREVPN